MGNRSTPASENEFTSARPVVTWSRVYEQPASEHEPMLHRLRSSHAGGAGMGAGGHSVEAPVQTCAGRHGSVEHTTPASLSCFGGQVAPRPLHTELASQTPTAGLQTRPDANESGGQVVVNPVHRSSTSQRPSAERHSTPASTGEVEQVPFGRQTGIEQPAGTPQSEARTQPAPPPLPPANPPASPPPTEPPASPPALAPPPSPPATPPAAPPLIPPAAAPPAFPPPALPPAALPPARPPAVMPPATPPARPPAAPPSGSLPATHTFATQTNPSGQFIDVAHGITDTSGVHRSNTTSNAASGVLRIVTLACRARLSRPALCSRR